MKIQLGFSNYNIYDKNRESEKILSFYAVLLR